MANLKNYEIQVKMFMDEGKWLEAYKLCNEIITLVPDNSTFIKLRNKIEKEVNKNNQKSIEAELAKLEPLLKEKKYEEYLKKIAPLQGYAEDFPIIKEKIIKAKKLFDSDFSSRQAQALREEISLINKQVENANYAEAIQRIEQLKKLNIQKQQLLKLENTLKKQWLDYELQQNAGLLNSQKFEDTIIFLLKLKKIDPNNLKINSLIENTKKSYKLFKIDHQKDYIFKTTEEIKTLYIRKDYEKALILCDKILEIDDTNAQVLAYKAKATTKNRIDSTKKVEKHLQMDYSNFKNTTDFKNQNYISI